MREYHFNAVIAGRGGHLGGPLVIDGARRGGVPRAVRNHHGRNSVVFEHGTFRVELRALQSIKARGIYSRAEVYRNQLNNYARFDRAYRDDVVESHFRGAVVVVRRGFISDSYVIRARVHGKSLNISAVQNIFVNERAFGNFAHSVGKRYAETLRGYRAGFSGERVRVATRVFERDRRRIYRESLAYFHPFCGRSVVVVCNGRVFRHHRVRACVNGHVVISAAHNVSERNITRGRGTVTCSGHRHVVQRHAVRKRVVSVLRRLIIGHEFYTAVCRKVVTLYDDSSHKRSHRPRSYFILGARLVVNHPYRINTRVRGRNGSDVRVYSGNVVDAFRGGVAVLEVHGGVCLIEFLFNVGLGIGIIYILEIAFDGERNGQTVVNLALGLGNETDFRQSRGYFQTFRKNALVVKYGIDINFRVAIVVGRVRLVYRKHVVNSRRELIIAILLRRRRERLVGARFAEHIGLRPGDERNGAALYSAYGSRDGVLVYSHRAERNLIYAVIRDNGRDALYRQRAQKFGNGRLVVVVFLRSERHAHGIHSGARRLLVAVSRGIAVIERQPARVGGAFRHRAVLYAVHRNGARLMRLAAIIHRNGFQIKYYVSLFYY